MQLILVADKPVKGFRGRRGLCRKWPPTEDTENELHMDPMVPTEDTEAVSRLSSATGDAHPESLIEKWVNQKDEKKYSPLITYMFSRHLT